MINLLVFKIFAITGVHKIRKMKNKPTVVEKWGKTKCC